MPDFHLYQIRPASAVRDGLDPDRAVASALAMARIGQIRQALDLEMHVFTAVVRARDLEDLFHKTSTADADWTEGSKVLESAEGAQATGVGDIAVDPEIGDAWLCATFGWESLSWDRSERFIVDATHRSHPDGIPNDDVAMALAW